MEEGGPGRIRKFEVIDSMRSEQPPVELRNPAFLVAVIHKPKQSLEALPARIGDGMKTGDAVRLGNRLFREQLAVFAEGDEHDAVEQPLRHFNRVVERMLQFEMELI